MRWGVLAGHIIRGMIFMHHAWSREGGATVYINLGIQE